MATGLKFDSTAFCVCPMNANYVIAAPKYDLKVYCGNCKQSHFVAACKEVSYDAFRASVLARTPDQKKGSRSGLVRAGKKKKSL